MAGGGRAAERCNCPPSGRWFVYVVFVRDVSAHAAGRVIVRPAQQDGAARRAFPDGSGAAEAVSVRQEVCTSRVFIGMLAGGGKAAERCNCPPSGWRGAASSSWSVFVFVRRIGELLGWRLARRSRVADEVIRPAQQDGRQASGR